MLRSVLPGSVASRLAKIEELNTRRDFGGERLSQLEGAHLSMLWRQEGLRDAMRAHGYGEDFQANLEKWLKPETKAIREWLHGEYEAQYDRINAVFRRMYGVDLPKVDFYAPAFFETRGKDSAMAPSGEEQQPVHLGGLGSLKNRSQHTARPIKIGALEAYALNAHMVEHWIAWAEPMRELRALFGNVDVSRAVRATEGPGMMSNIRQQLDILEAGGARNADAQGQAAALMRRFSQGVRDQALVAQMAVMGKHVHSALSSMADLGIADYSRSAARVMSGQSAISFWDMLNSPAVERRRSQYPAEWKEACKGFNNEVGAIRSAIDSATGNARRNVALGLDWLRGRLPYVDSTAAAFSMATAYDAHFLDAKDMGFDDPAAHAYANERMEITTMRTQLPESMLSKSLLENKSGPWAKALWMFMAPSRKAMGTFILAAKRVQKERSFESVKGLGQQLAIHWVISGLVTQTIGNLIRYMRHGDDLSDNFKLSDYARSIALGPISGIYILGPLLEGVAAHLTHQAGGHLESQNPASIADLVKAVDTFKDHSDKNKLELKDYGDALSKTGAFLGGDVSALGVAWNIVKQALDLEQHFNGTAPKSNTSHGHNQNTNGKHK